MPLYQAIQAFNAADATWQAALVAAFGSKRASLLRYKPEGRGVEGSALRVAYVQREGARRVYEAAWNARLCQ
jgi:hypothetical protein